jgi:hypothetical protein
LTGLVLVWLAPVLAACTGTAASPAVEPVSGAEAAADVFLTAAGTGL